MVKSLKKITVVTSVLLMVFMSFFCFGSYAYGDTQHMVDYSGYLYDSEVSEINDYLSAVSEEMEFDIVGVMINEGYDENSLRSFADDFYDYGGYGYGTEKDGAVFVVDMESRLMTLVTTGFGITAIWSIRQGKGLRSTSMTAVRMTVRENMKEDFRAQKRPQVWEVSHSQRAPEPDSYHPSVRNPS